MKTASLKLAAFAVLVLGNTLAIAQVSFSWATVGNPGNPADPLNSGSIPGIGSVGYTYNIATTEVTIFQYVAFLNAVDPNGLNTYGLYSSAMTTEQNFAGVNYTAGAAAGAKYSVIGSGNRPIMPLMWTDAARFANWFQNGQGSGSTETGVYDMSLTKPTRSATATYVLASENEWYKAAYYDPTRGGSNYWLYPTRSDTAPGNTIGSLPNQANYYDGDYATTPGVGGASQSNQNYLTDVGAFSGSASYYGTYDQGGNASEWTDTVAGFGMVLRGGNWDYSSLGLQSSFRATFDPTLSMQAGIRMASVPEPTTDGLLLLVGAGWLLKRRSKSCL